MDDQTHTYVRGFQPGERSSLSVIASYIPQKSTVLDVGTGSGALGRYLKSEKSCTIDGVTLSREEAELCKPFYQKIDILDIENPSWKDSFPRNHYDCIVFADVLEHTKNPQRLLTECRQLLAKDGLLLISIPNIGYAYLIAELIKGEFEYGPEGLLDKTHLRFFTRRSFDRLLSQSGWYVSAYEPIHQSWHETEFRLKFDDLPPKVGSYILSQPDAHAYQWVFVARQANKSETQRPVSPPVRKFSSATFLAQVYVVSEHGIEASRPINSMGNIGEDHQSIDFFIPNDFNVITGIRLDVADRAGYMRIEAIEGLEANGEQVFKLEPRALRQALASPSSHQLIDITPCESDDAIWLRLTGEDPHFHLPLQKGDLQAWVGDGRSLKVWCSWPWSADYNAACQGEKKSNVSTPPKITSKKSAAWLHQLLSIARELLTPRPIGSTEPAKVTEIIVPVFNSLHLTRRCLESLLASRNHFPLHITVINDGSTDPEVRPWLEFFASQHPEVTAIENVVNQGFVKTVNLGMRIAGNRDAVLLNSDTQVTHHWLDRLRAIALNHEKTASVTPFSNNATICSFPRFCAENPFPTTETLACINKLAGTMFPQRAIPIPTAVGFCMYIKRSAWNAVGEFDHKTFGLGYGEENDWCMRAAKAGWTHLHALDVYVAHQGGASFSDRRHRLQESALKSLLVLHPDYNEKVQAYVKEDPAGPQREALASALTAECASDTPTP